MVPSVEVHGVSKRYTLFHSGHSGTPSVREAVAGFGARLLGRTAPWGREDFWALRDIDFTIAPGERVGVIGKNGAGKSTLLKLLSRITEPTRGHLTLRGRVASLLEVGTGFHQELSGRDNIYLNGTILGMRRAEVRAKFDAIVGFSEIERFLDMPVKKYSSGMYTRLAFAVAAHLDPEVLIVDEVLAVGDQAFQSKCLDKMQEFGNQGRTVLFVSHNMSAVERLCGRALLLDGGKLLHDSTDVRSLVAEYVGTNEKQSVWRADPPMPLPVFRPEAFYVAGPDGLPLTAPSSNADAIAVVIEGEVTDLDTGLSVGFALNDSSGTLLFRSFHTDNADTNRLSLQRGRWRLLTKIPRRFLNEGTYQAELFIALHQRQTLLEPGRNSPRVTFEILGGLSDSAYWMTGRAGLLAPELPWSAQSL